MPISIYNLDLEREGEWGAEIEALNDALGQGKELNEQKGMPHHVQHQWSKSISLYTQYIPYGTL